MDDFTKMKCYLIGGILIMLGLTILVAIFAAQCSIAMLYM
ncbi:hypothetical protein ES703_60985 [subsurface metagenome]